MYLRHRAASIYLLHWQPLRSNCLCVSSIQATSRHASGLSRKQLSVHGEGEGKSLKKKKAKAVKTHKNNEVNTKDLFINDLAATLEAHRASNRAKIIRKIAQPPPQYKDWKRLTIFEDGEKAQTKIRQDAKEPGDNLSRSSSTEANRSRPKESNPRGSSLVRRVDSNRRFKVVYIKGSSLTRRVNSKRGLKEVHVHHGEPVFTFPDEKFSQPPSSEKHPVSNHPWMDYVDSVHEDPTEQLSSELRALEAYMRLTAAEEAASKQIVFDVRFALLGAFAFDQIQLLGSRRTDLTTPTSDFDFYISPARKEDGSRAGKQAIENLHRKKETQTLRKVEKCLRIDERFASVRTINAKARLVRAVHRGTGASVEFQTRNSLSTTNEQIKAWTQELPSLRALFIALRTHLESCHLRAVMRGGIDSYTLVVMIVTALQHARGSYDQSDLAGQLLHILSFWGSADLSRYAYSAKPPQVYEKRDVDSVDAKSVEIPEARRLQRAGIDHIRRESSKEPHLLCLQDPTDYLNDLGRNSFAIKEVQALFLATHKRLSDKTRTQQRPLPGEEEEEKEKKIKTPEPPPTHPTEKSILHTMIQADFTPFERARSQLHHFATPAASPPPAVAVESLSHEQQARALEYRQRRDAETALLQQLERGLQATLPRPAGEAGGKPLRF